MKEAKKQGKEWQVWLMAAGWGAYIALLGPWLFSAESDSAVMIGIVLFLVMVRVTYSVIKNYDEQEAKWPTE